MSEISHRVLRYYADREGVTKIKTHGKILQIYTAVYQQDEIAIYAKVDEKQPPEILTVHTVSTGCRVMPNYKYIATATDTSKGRLIHVFVEDKNGHK